MAGRVEHDSQRILISVRRLVTRDTDPRGEGMFDGKH